MTMPDVIRFEPEEIELDEIRREAQAGEETCMDITSEVMIGLQDDEWWGFEKDKILAISEQVEEIHRAFFRVRKSAEHRLKTFRELLDYGN